MNVHKLFGENTCDHTINLHKLIFRRNTNCVHSVYIPLLKSAGISSLRRQKYSHFTSMGSCKKDVTPLLMQWSFYIFLARTHRLVVIIMGAAADLVMLGTMASTMLVCSLQEQLIAHIARVLSFLSINIIIITIMIIFIRKLIAEHNLYKMPWIKSTELLTTFPPIYGLLNNLVPDIYFLEWKCINFD